MSDYNLFDVAVDYSATQSVDDYKYRKGIINAVSNLRNDNGFAIFYKRYVSEYGSNQKKPGEFTKEDFRKFYVSENYMESVIGKFTSYMPRLKMKTDIDGKVFDLINRSLTSIKWESTLYESICDTMESKGDVYLAIYFDKAKDKLPKIRALKSENMIDIIVDENEIPLAYVYEEENVKVDKKINPLNGEIINGSVVKQRFVFTKGRVTKYVDGSNPTVIHNNECILDEIPLIHIQAENREGQVFSNIPAKSYIEDVLHLDKCTTLVSQTLQYQGFGLKYITDGKLVKGSRPVPGGHIGIESDSITLNKGKQAIISDFQIRNELKANFNEKIEVKSALYEKAKLIAPQTEQIVGKTDSGKVFQHFRLPLQTKVRRYRDSIIDGMSLWFKALLCSNDITGEQYEGLSFYKDKYVIETSTDEKILNQQLEVVTQVKTVEEIKQENGDNPEEIKKVLDENKKKEEVNNEENIVTNVKKA